MTHYINDFFPLASGVIFRVLQSFLPDWLAWIITTAVSITVLSVDNQSSVGHRNPGLPHGRWAFIHDPRSPARWTT